MITKYRGLSISDNNKGQWVYGNLIVDSNYAYIVNGVIECNDQYITIAEWCPVDHKTIGAFTGLFDKNGKEIFESDIVKTTRFFGRADESGGFYEYEKEFIGIVKQLEGAWVIDTEKGAVYLWSDIDENEILGNTWENPEL